MRIVIDINDEDYKRIHDISDVFNSLTSRAYSAIRNGTPLPSVEPERKTGKWIRAIDPDVNAWTGGHTCSECGRACVQMSMNYCANCGAPMEVET